MRKDARGVALVSVLVVILILSLLAGLLLYLSGQEAGISRVRYRGVQSLAIAEGGAWAGRAALMAVVNADPTDKANFMADLSTTAVIWYAGGIPDAQNPLAFLNYVQLDGQLLGTGTGPYDWVVFWVNWALPYPYLKLQFVRGGSGAPPEDPLALGPAPTNQLGNGVYRAALVLSKKAEPHESCTPPGSPCFVHFTPPTVFTIPVKYRVVAEGHVDPQFRRRVSLEGEFRVVLGNTSFAQWHGFFHRFTLSNGRPVYYYVTETLDGPVHTNDRFRFWGFPKFGTPDTSSPCDPGRIVATRLTSTDRYAVFRRLPGSGSGPMEVTIDANEWVRDGVRLAAPVLPDCTPENFNDDSDNPAAQFQREFDGDPRIPGIQPITVPPNSFNQRAITLGWNPADTTPNTWTEAQWNRRVREVVPELPDSSSSVPNGIYIPVSDTNANSISDEGEPLAGGIYVQGNLRSLVMSNCPPGSPSYPYCPAATGDLAYYAFEHTNGQRALVVVDRANNRTTVTNSAWPPGSRTRTFTGVPKGWQGTLGYQNATMIYVRGNIGRSSEGGVWGQLEEREQVLITASRGNPSDPDSVYIPNHIRYERPPNPYDPTDNPLNVFGLFVPTGRIRIPTSSPPNMDMQGVFMAGQPGVNDPPVGERVVDGVCSLPNKGELRLLGGLIAEFAGVTGCVSGGTVRGYSEHSVYDRRMSRGFAPPYFPTTTLPLIQAERLAGQRPRWQELSPP